VTNPLRWGILGTGNIARQFAAGVAGSTRGNIAAVASRDLAKAKSFATAIDISAALGSYEALLQRDDIDAVYVSLPNTLHHEWTIAALRAGKHVLCEKPFAVKVQQAKEMFAAADAAGRVVMEAFMYRCHPQTHAVQREVSAGRIGQVRQVRTSFCYRTTRIVGNVRFDPALAGGALMDVGCYCISFAAMLLGEPLDGSAAGSIHPTGVDDLCTGWMKFSGDAVASFTCGTGLQANNTAYICGTEGYIEVPVPWKPPAGGGEYVIAGAQPPRQDFAAGKAPPAPPRESVKVEAAGDVYGIEADAFAAVVQDGAPLPVSRQDTLVCAKWLERFRRDLGLLY
jgi:xylose dehydrogenase (NAD/NADP)